MMKLTILYLKLKHEITVLIVVLYWCEQLSATKIEEKSRVRISQKGAGEYVLA